MRGLPLDRSHPGSHGPFASNAPEPCCDGGGGNGACCGADADRVSAQRSNDTGDKDQSRKSTPGLLLRNLGRAHASGTGLPQDRVTSHMYLSLAASMGDNAAKDLLETVEADMSTEDIGASRTKAREWLQERRLAAQSPH